MSDIEAMEDLLMACTLLSLCGTEPMFLCDNHERQFMKTYELVETMEDQFLTCVYCRSVALGRYCV